MTRNKNKKDNKEVKDLEQGLINLDRYLKAPTVCECGNNYVYVGLGEY